MKRPVFQIARRLGVVSFAMCESQSEVGTFAAQRIHHRLADFSSELGM
jgi:hypothetical protein